MDRPTPRRPAPRVTTPPAIESGSPGGTPARRTPPPKAGGKPRDPRLTDLSADDEGRALTAEDLAYGERTD